MTIPPGRSAIRAAVTGSIGVASARWRPHMSPDLMITHADRQLYASKASKASKAEGRNKISALTFDASGPAQLCADPNRIDG